MCGCVRVSVPVMGSSTGFGEYTGTVIEHVELDGQRDVSGNSGSIGVCCRSYTLRYANVYGFRVSAKMSGDNVIENSWMHDHWGANGSHGDGGAVPSGGSNHDRAQQQPRHHWFFRGVGVRCRCTATLAPVNERVDRAQPVLRRRLLHLWRQFAVEAVSGRHQHPLTSTTTSARLREPTRQCGQIRSGDDLQPEPHRQRLAGQRLARNRPTPTLTQTGL